MLVQEKNGVAVITVDERLDVVSAGALKDTIRELVDQNKIKVVIDLQHTKFIDSSGCGALVASLRSLIKCKGDMKVSGPSSQARSLFELTRLYRVFEIYDNLEGALNSFKP
jgi:anti-sigma B factor antagonist